MGRCPLVGNEEAHQWGQMVNVIESLYNKSTNAVTSNSNIFRCKVAPWAKTIKKNTNSTQNKSQTHRAKQYEVTSFLSTDCELSTETCSKNVYSLGPLSPSPFNIFLEQTKTNALDKGITLKMCCYTTGENNLEHTVTNEAVKQMIWYLICAYCMRRFWNRSLEDTSMVWQYIPTGSQVCLHMAWCMVCRKRLRKYEKNLTQQFFLQTIWQR